MYATFYFIAWNRQRYVFLSIYLEVANVQENILANLIIVLHEQSLLFWYFIIATIYHMGQNKHDFIR